MADPRDHVKAVLGLAIPSSNGWAESGPETRLGWDLEKCSISLHESGQVHIYSQSAPPVGPVPITPLGELTGEHVATVQ